MNDAVHSVNQSNVLVFAEEAVSDWIKVTQEMIVGFGAATLDPDPMHIDPAWAKQHSPYRQTIAFGFQTMSLLTYLMHSAKGTRADNPVDPEVGGHFLNYGFDHLRLVTPVLEGTEIRGRFKLIDKRIDAKAREIATFDSVIEIKGEARPALVAKWLAVWVPATTR